MQKKKSQKALFFLDNYIWIFCVELSLLRTEYLLSADNVSKNGRKILQITKSDFFQLSFLQRHQ